MMHRSFLSLNDLTAAELAAVLETAARFKKDRRAAEKLLPGRSIGLLFEKPSTRTRVSFEVGIQQLGAQPVVLNASEVQLKRGESIEDTARVLSRYLDAVMMRTYSHETLEDLHRYGSIPVINGLSDRNHPCQILADFQTIIENGFELSETRICFFGDGSSNVCNSLIRGCIKTGASIAVACPDEYKPAYDVIKEAAEAGVQVEILRDPLIAAEGCNVLYTDVFVSMGQEAETKKKVETLLPYQINKNVLKAAEENALLLHCLPAHKGEEVSHEAFESRAATIFDQAENRLHAQKALVAHLFDVI